MTHLVPCPGCRRHVRVSEATCPFCATALSLANTPPPVLPATRLGRAATFAFGATLLGASAVAGCSGESEERGGDDGKGGASGSSNNGGSNNGGSNNGGSNSGGSSSGGNSGTGSGGTDNIGGGMALYGAPPVGGTTGSGGTQNTGGGGGIAQPYGVPPDAGVQPPYGIPPDPDGGFDDDGGGAQPEYGAAPAD